MVSSGAVQQSAHSTQYSMHNASGCFQAVALGAINFAANAAHKPSLPSALRSNSMPTRDNVTRVPGSWRSESNRAALSDNSPPLHSGSLTSVKQVRQWSLTQTATK